MTVELDVLLEFRDYLRASYWFLFRKFKLMLFLLLFAGFVYPLLLLTRSLSGSSDDNYWGFLIPIGMLLFVIGGTYSSAKRHLASNKGLSERIHYTFSENGIDALAPSSSGHTTWSNLYEAHETKNNFLLFISRNMMYTIPKRCFHDAEQISAFKELLRSQLASRAKLK